MIFKSTVINSLVLPNRFVRSATWEGLATEDGKVSPRLIATLTKLAQGQVGLIIAGHAYVTPDGQATPWQLGIHDDQLIPGLISLTDTIHNAGGKIAIQLAHAGFFAARRLTNSRPRVVSDFDGLTEQDRSELTAEDIRRLISSYAEAARRAITSGFDAIQIHSAHGYLLSQFLSPAFNRRTDTYGGEIGNRARIHLEIYKAIRNVVGENYPLMIKINCDDFSENGLTREDSRVACRMLSEAGFDAIELSGGLLTGGKLSPSRYGIDSPEKEAYFQDAARALKKQISCPLILVGGIRSPKVAEKLLADGTADYIALSRPLIREPHLIARWKSGDLTPSGCQSDNLCFRPGLTGDGVYCVVKEQEMRSR